MENNSEIKEAAEPDASSKKKGWEPIRFERLAAKELRETLRDKRTIATLFLMPLLVYPILSLLFQGFLVTNLTPATDDVSELLEPSYRYVFGSEELLREMLFGRSGKGVIQRGFELTEVFDRTRERILNPQKEEANENDTEDNESNESGRQEPRKISDLHELTYVDEDTQAAVEAIVRKGEADVGIFKREIKIGNMQGEFLTLVYQEDSLRSMDALKYMTRILDNENISAHQRQLLDNRIPPVRRPMRTSLSVVADAPAQAISFVALVPLILTLMTITGAVYPAIDLTAGERERGTLESLIAAPVPRMRILLGKLVAVVVVALMTAVVNLVGMMVTIWVFQLDNVLFGESGLAWYSVVQIFGLLVLFAGFFASVLLVITSFARSFKEGQAYLIPLMMLALAPSLMSLKPDLELKGLWSIMPLVNIVLLSRDVLTNSVSLGPGIVAIASTVFYAALAITIAARFFGTPQVLYGESQGIGTLFTRPRERRETASASLAMLCLAFLFPASFIWQGVLGRVAAGTTPDDTSAAENVDAFFGPVAIQAMFASLGIIVVFFLIPWLVTQFHRVRFKSGYRISLPSLVGWIAAILLGIGLGPLLMQAVASSGHWIELLNDGGGSSSDLLARAEEQAAKLKTLPLWAVLLAFALVPAIFEELFFRGLLFQSLRQAMGPWKTILATGVMFGVFHLITTSGLGLSRILPTTLMGFILGWVCWRTGSVLPGMILHGIHNAMALSLAYFRDDLVAAEWITADQSSVPWEILAGAFVLTVVGIALLAIVRSSDSTLPSAKPQT